MISSRVIAFAAAAAAFLSALPVVAKVPANVQIVDCRTHDAAQEKADHDLAMTTLDIMQTHDIARLNERLPNLKAALAHAPDSPSLPERCGDTIIVYSDQMSDMLTLSALLSGHEKDLGATKVEQREALPYALLAFEAGWIDFENKDYDAAHEAYAKGLRNDPDDHAVILEDTLTLAALKRSPEALAQLDAYLARNDDLPDELMAGALRKRGYVLVELGRWDEAEAAYKESLKLAPGDQTAQGELEYIAQNRPSKPAN
ncbi:MAG: tetratricopeptide repeat protein [Asticcacaulis sp.]|uniref:tetratricopeptide repeat protein n=1 Tax=Asticcacaulis sp. TaxID=1872648 RepID=UPI0039E2ED31